MKMLETATGVDSDQLQEFLCDMGNLKFSEDSQTHQRIILRLYTLLDPLTEGMQVTEDERIKGLIDVLIQEYGMSNLMIARYSELEEEKLRLFKNGKDVLSYKEKYTLSVKVYSLIVSLRC